MTKLEQCKTCAHDVYCNNTQTCKECQVKSPVQLTSIRGHRTACLCLTIEYDKPCPYYKQLKEVTVDDKA